MPFPRRHHDVPLPGGRRLVLGPRTLVMAILNVTPDSFAEPGSRLDPGEAVDRAVACEAEGADLIDIGGESTRPGADAVPAAEELARVLPVLRALAPRVRVPLSIDTYKAAVAARALDEGVLLVNDISGLGYDPDLAGVLAARAAGVVLMHNRGRSRAMYREARYGDVGAEVARDLAAALERARRAGIADERVVLDPGLGFAKRPVHSYAALAALPRLAAIGRPLLVGPSRKSFLEAALGGRPPAARDWGTAAAVTAAVLLGAHIVRVHAVAEMVQVVRVADAVRDAGAGEAPRAGAAGRDAVPEA